MEGRDDGIREADYKTVEEMGAGTEAVEAS